MAKLNIIKDILVFVFVYIPPLIVFSRFWKEYNRSKILLVIIQFLYTALSLFTQNLIPFIFVLINIRYIRSADNFCRLSTSKLITYDSTNEKKHIISNRIREDYTKFKFSIKNFQFIEGLKVVAISYLITICISMIQTVLLSKFKVELKQQEIVTHMENMSLMSFFIMVPIVTIFAPIVEEFVFRWILFEKVFVKRLGVYAGALLSSIIFGFIHFSVNAFPVILCLGLCNCYLIHKKGYWYAVFNHFIFNSMTTLALFIEKLSLK